MTQSVAGGLIVAAQKINVENALPRAPTPRPRLDLAQADISQRKQAERLEKCPGQVSHLKGDRGLIGPAWNQAVIFRTSRLAAPLACALSNQKKAGEIALVVFDARLQDFPAIFAGRLAAGDPCRIVQLVGHDVLHAAGRVVERYRLDLAMAAEEIAALVERY